MRQESVQISEIEIGKDRRKINAVAVASLKESIETIGLLQPILINMEYRLIAGLHRLEAVKAIGLKTITCWIMECDSLMASLAEIDENLMRHELNALERAQELKHRKVLYQNMHPETKEHVAGALASNKSQGKKTQGTAMSSASFADDTAAITGVSKRSVNRDVAIAEKLSAPVQAAIKDHPIADNKAELSRLAALSEKDQKVVAKAIVSGKAKTVDKAKGAFSIVDAETKTKPGKNGQEVLNAAFKREVLTTFGRLVRMCDKLKIGDKCRAQLKFIDAAIKDA